MIRPVGGTLVAMKTLGATDPARALPAGSAPLVAHRVKASTRLAINTSPEAVSTIVVNTAVLGGLALMAISPIVVGIAFVARSVPQRHHPPRPSRLNNFAEPAPFDDSC